MGETSKGENIRAFCSKCRGERNCRIHGQLAESGGDVHFDWHKDWYLLTCCGCDHVFAQSVSTNSEEYYDYYDDDGEHLRQHEETILQWPAKSVREKPDWFSEDLIESDKPTRALEAALHEVYGALDQGLIVLASIGVRTCFDIAAEALEVESSHSFQEKVKDLVDRGLIRDSEREHIDILIDAGSAAAHRGWKPKLPELDILMGILETFIYNNFVLPGRDKLRDEKIKEMKGRVPAKKPRERKGKNLPHQPPDHDDIRDQK